MQRNTKTPIQRLLASIHANQMPAPLSPDWREEVMNRIARMPPANPAPDWERLAPRFTLAAATLSVLLLVTATVGLASLPEALSTAINNQYTSVVPTTLSSL